MPETPSAPGKIIAPGALLIQFVLGTRPEAIKLAPVIQACRHYKHVTAEIVSTGQHRELLDGVLDIWGLQADADLALMVPHQDLHTLAARAIAGLGDFFLTNRANIVVVQGDTATAFAAAWAAFLLGIPVAHVEAGLRTHDLSRPFPEEANRRLIAQIAHWHFAPTTTAKTNLLNEGVSSDRIFVTGNTVVDALESILGRAGHRNDPRTTARKVVVTVHRRENHGLALLNVCEAVRRLAVDFPDATFVWPLHPNPHVAPVVRERLGDIANVSLTEPLDYRAFLNELQNSCLLLSDSGGAQEESAALGIPAVVLRDSTERVEGVKEGLAVLVGTETPRIVEVASQLLRSYRSQSPVHSNSLYGRGDAGLRIAQVLAGSQ